jgi:FkbM family methyltransferase
MRNHVSFDIPAMQGLPLLRSNVLNILWEIWHETVYTPPFVRLATASTVVDAGANFGAFTAFAARQASEGRVVALEPVPYLFQYLQRNVDLNHLHNVMIAPKGLLNRRCVESIAIHRENLGGHSIFGASMFHKENRIDVEFIKLSDLFDDFRLEFVDLLKMDIEGAEFPVLLETSPRIFMKIRQISMEYHLGPTRRLEDLCAFLGQVGYTVRTEPVASDRGMLWATRWPAV